MLSTEQIATILSSIAGSGALTAGIVFLTKTWLSERLVNSIRHEYDQKFAVFQADIRAAEAEKYDARSSFGTAHSAAFVKRLDAMQAIWTAIMELRRKTPMVLVMFDHVQGNRFQELIANMKDNEKVLEQVSFETVGSELGPIAQKAEEARLLAGDQMGAFFDAYKSLIVIASSLLYVALKQGHGQAWHEGNQVNYLLETFLSSEELAEFHKQTFKMEWVRKAIERKVLAYAQNVVSGRESGDIAYRHAKEIQEAAYRAQMNADPSFAINEA